MVYAYFVQQGCYCCWLMSIKSVCRVLKLMAKFGTMQDVEQNQIVQACILVIMSSRCHLIDSQCAQRMFSPLACSSRALPGLLCATSEWYVCS